MTDFIFNYTFVLNMLYDYIIIYDYKTEGKRERKKERNITACHWMVLPL